MREGGAKLAHVNAPDLQTAGSVEDDRGGASVDPTATAIRGESFHGTGLAVRTAQVFITFVAWLCIVGVVSSCPTPLPFQ